MVSRVAFWSAIELGARVGSTPFPSGGLPTSSLWRPDVKEYVKAAIREAAEAGGGGFETHAEIIDLVRARHGFNVPTEIYYEVASACQDVELRANG